MKMLIQRQEIQMPWLEREKEDRIVKEKELRRQEKREMEKMERKKERAEVPARTDERVSRFQKGKGHCEATKTSTSKVHRRG